MGKNSMNTKTLPALNCRLAAERPADLLPAAVPTGTFLLPRVSSSNFKSWVEVKLKAYACVPVLEYIDRNLCGISSCQQCAN